MEWLAAMTLFVVALLECLHNASGFIKLPPVSEEFSWNRAKFEISV